MFDPAGIGLRNLGINTCDTKLLGKEATALINILCNPAGRIGQMEKCSSSIVRKPPSRKVATAWHTLGFDISMCRARSTERTILWINAGCCFIHIKFSHSPQPILHYFATLLTNPQAFSLFAEIL